MGIFEDILTGRHSMEDVYMEQIDRELEKQKPLLLEVTKCSLYIEFIKQVLIDKEFVTKEEMKELDSVIEEKVQEAFDEQCAKAREIAKKNFAEEMRKAKGGAD